jgi:hypothetical protein
MSSLSSRLRAGHQYALFDSMAAQAATLVFELQRAKLNHVSQLAEVDFLVRWIEANIVKLRGLDLTRVGTLQRALMAKFQRARALLNRDKTTAVGELEDESLSRVLVTAARKSALLADIKSKFAGQDATGSQQNVSDRDGDFEMRMQAIVAQIDQMRERLDRDATVKIGGTMADLDTIDVVFVARKTATMRQLLALNPQLLVDEKEIIECAYASSIAMSAGSRRRHDQHDQQLRIGDVQARRTVRLPILICFSLLQQIYISISDSGIYFQ